MVGAMVGVGVGVGVGAMGSSVVDAMVGSGAMVDDMVDSGADTMVDSGAMVSVEVGATDPCATTSDIKQARTSHLNAIFKVLVRFYRDSKRD